MRSQVLFKKLSLSSQVLVNKPDSGLIKLWYRCQKEHPPTYAGGNGRSALLVAFGTSVTSDARHTIFAGTLPCSLITGFSSCTHGMAITCCGGEHTTKGSEEGFEGKEGFTKKNMCYQKPMASMIVLPKLWTLSEKKQSCSLFFDCALFSIQYQCFSNLPLLVNLKEK